MIKKCSERGLKDMATSISKNLTLEKLTLTVMGFKVSTIVKDNIKALFSKLKSFSMI